MPGETEIGLSSGQFFLLFLDWYIQKNLLNFFGYVPRNLGTHLGKTQLPKPSNRAAHNIKCISTINYATIFMPLCFDANVLHAENVMKWATTRGHVVKPKIGHKNPFRQELSGKF